MSIYIITQISSAWSAGNVGLWGLYETAMHYNVSWMNKR